MIRLKTLLLETQTMRMPNALGDAWNACKKWNSSGKSSSWNGTDGRPNITVMVSQQELYLSYEGKTSGFEIATPNNETDSIHQVFNILICEGNPFLEANPGLKPNLDAIATTSAKLQQGVSLTISIPFVQENDNVIYQFNRRGGWMYDPGAAAVVAASKQTAYEIISEPITVYIKTNFKSESNDVSDGITEHFLLLKQVKTQ